MPSRCRLEHNVLKLTIRISVFYEISRIDPPKKKNENRYLEILKKNSWGKEFQANPEFHDLQRFNNL